MANTGSYSMCMRGTDEAIEELRALLNSDAFPSIYGCDNFGFDEPNRFNGEFNGSFLNSVDIYDEESLFRSTVAQLGLEVEVYGQEVGSSYEEHFVIEGDSLTVDEQDGNAFDEPIADLTLDEIDEIAKTYGMGASRDAVIKAYDNGNIRFGGYEWNFNFAPAYARENDPVLQERFLKFLEDGVKESGTGIFTISDAADLSEAGFTQAQAMEMFRFFDQNNVDYKSGVDWALSMNGDSVTGFVATCHGAWPGGVERVTDIEFRRLTDGAGFAARQDLERIDELSDEARNAELGNLFEDASKLQPSDSLAEFIRSDIQRTVEFAVSEYAHEQTLGVDDWRIEAARADVIGDEEFNRIFGVDDDDRMGLSAFTGELKDAAEHKHGDDSISRNEPEHDGR